MIYPRPILVKAGDGPTIVEGAVIRVHFRAAAHLHDLDDDALVLSSTYGSGTPVTLRLDRGVVKLQVLDALLGLSVGSTVVVPLELDPAGSSRSDSSGRVFVEIWIIDIQNVRASERQTWATVHIGLAPDVRAELISALRNGSVQKNGVVIRLNETTEAPLLTAAEEIRAVSGEPAPYRLVAGGTTASRTTSYLLAAGLHKKLTDHFGNGLE
jgi:hypothetical protein